MNDNLKRVKRTILGLLFLLPLILSGCDNFEEDVMPEAFADIRLHSEVIYLPGNGGISLEHFVNDTLPAFHNVTYSAPKHGDLVTDFAGVGLLGYIPDENFVGTDSITYTVCVGKSCKSATMKFVVEEPMDINNCTSVLEADLVETTVNTPVDIRIFEYDRICPREMQSQWWLPQRGSYTIYDFNGSGTASNKNLVFRYTPPKDYRGTDSFFYRVYPPDTYPDGDYLEMYVTINIK